LMISSHLMHEVYEREIPDYDLNFVQN
jgi:hypothetical protein